MIAFSREGQVRRSSVRSLTILNSPHPVPLARELRTMRQKVRFIYQLFVQPPLLRLLLPSLLRRAGRFTEADIEVMKESWRDPAARRAMANYYRALRRHRRALRPLIRPIEIPVMLIWGERDPVFVRETTERFDEWVPNLRVERIARAGHFVQTDQPERVNELLLGFLER